MHHKIRIISIILLLVIIVVGGWYFLFRKIEYPIIKKTKIDGEMYIREIYPKLEIRYPKINIESDNKECIVKNYSLIRANSGIEDDSDNMRRIVLAVYRMPELYADENIEKFSLRSANSSVIITNDNRISLINEKNNKIQYTSKWVDVNPDEQDNLKIHIVCSIPIKLLCGEFHATESNAENYTSIEKINNCIIQAKILYKDGHEEMQYLTIESERKTHISEISIYRINLE